MSPSIGVRLGKPFGLSLTILSFVILFLAIPAVALIAPAPRDASDYQTTYDVRLHGGTILDALSRGYSRGQFQEMARAGDTSVRLMKDLVSRRGAQAPDVLVDRSPLTGSAEVVRARSGAGVGPASERSAADIAHEFLRARAGLYGLTEKQVGQLRILGESLSPKSGIRMVRAEQTVRGVPVFQGETRAIVDREGRVIRTVGRLVPGVEESLVPSPHGLISAPEALKAAMASVGIELDLARMRVQNAVANGFSAEVASDDPRITRTVTSKVVYFPLGPGVVVPAWSQVVFLRGLEAYYTVVDGRTGILLFRKSLALRFSTEEARFSVYTLPGGDPAASPAPGAPNSLRQTSTAQFPAIARRTESMLGVQDPVASPNGWIADGGTTTTGNNADVYLDRNFDHSPDPGTLDLDGRPVGNTDVNGRSRDFLGSAPRDFNYSPAPLGSNPDAGDDPSTAPYQRGSLTDFFYLVNYAHDRFYGLGFDEAAGNHQVDNFGRGGLGGDPILGEGNSGVDLGFFGNTGTIPAPDGISVKVDMGVNNGPTPFRDVALDADVLLHELAHTLTIRIVGNAAGLNYKPGGGLGEGWSDFYALSLLHGLQTDDPNAQYPIMAYSQYKFRGVFTGNYVYGARRFPYSTDNRVNPLTWADGDPTTFALSGGFNPSSTPLHPRDWAYEVHNLGEIWASSLWEVRSRIIAANGGSVPVGNEIALQLVTDGVKLTPVDPAFTQARDAILDADCAANACANEDSIWGGFAERGLGYKAETSSGLAEQIGVKESFALPSLDVGGVTIDDSLGNNNGFIDPGETISITVGLFNPWRAASKGIASASAILTSHTMEVGSISDKNSTYGPIPAQGTTTGDPFVFNVSSRATCGQSLEFNLKISASPTSSTVNFALRVGQPAGPGAPVVFQRVVPHGGVAIPNGSFLGVTDALTVTSDLVIDDLDFRLDSLTHTFVGQLSIGLKAPNGFASTLIHNLAECTPTSCSSGQNNGDNFVNTRIDDSATSDLYSAGAAAAPFTGSWIATLNSPRLGAFPPPDPVGELSKYQGLSTQGSWQVWVGDFRTPDSGSLNSWSLIVTPETFSCSP